MLILMLFEVQISKFIKISIFQALLQQKLKVVWKKFPGLKEFKIVWTFEWNHFHAKQIIFDHFKAKNVFLNFCHFWAKFRIIFSSKDFASAWNFFSFSEFANRTSQLLPGFSLVKKYLKLAAVRPKEGRFQNRPILKPFRTNSTFSNRQAMNFLRWFH